MITDDYVNRFKTSWSESTQRVERSRLKVFAPLLSQYINEGLNPLDAALSLLASKSPYYRKNTLGRLSHFLSEMAPQSVNVFAEHLKAHRRAYLGAYTPKILGVTYIDVESAIKAQGDKGFEKKALEILYSAQRYSESVQPKGPTVVGKGGKVRPDFRPNIVGKDYDKGYHTFVRTLKKLCGITPHGLRKLALTHMVEKGCKEADLMRVAGWSSIATASSYLQPKNDELLKNVLWEHKD